MTAPPNLNKWVTWPTACPFKVCCYPKANTWNSVTVHKIWPF